MTRFLLPLALILLALPAFAGDVDDYNDKPPPIVCERSDFCPDLERLVESELYAGLACKERAKACKRVASLEYACEREVVRGVFRTARRACETRDCQRVIRDGLKQSLDALQAQRKAHKALCASACEGE